MLLSAYLRNLGLQLDGPLAQQDAAGPERVRVAIWARKVFPNDKCVDYRDYVCRHADNPQSDDLIVVMPDDNASIADLDHIKQHATLLWEWKGPSFATKAGSWCRSLHAISRAFPRRPLPENWLQLHVFKARG
jgi:hypothetical protein